MGGGIPQEGGEKKTVWQMEGSLLIWWLKDEGILIWWFLVFFSVKCEIK